MKPSLEEVNSKLAFTKVVILKSYLGTTKRHDFKCLVCGREWSGVFLSARLVKCIVCAAKARTLEVKVRKKRGSFEGVETDEGLLADSAELCKVIEEGTISKEDSDKRPVSLNRALISLELVDVHRNVKCPFYDSCLAEIVGLDWKGFTCRHCPNFLVQQTPSLVSKTYAELRNDASMDE